MLGSLADLVLPRMCAGCRRPGLLLCPLCLPPEDPVEVAGIGVPTVAAARYEAGMRRALLAYKERGRRDLARPLGSALATLLDRAGFGADVVLVPVPSSLAARRARGRDHVVALTRVAASRHGVRAAPVLGFARDVLDSAGLDVRERARNLDRAMLARAPRVDRPAVVVDDIVTSGATLRESVRALRDAGWQVHGAAVLAATALRRGPESGGTFLWRDSAVGSSVRST